MIIILQTDYYLISIATTFSNTSFITQSSLQKQYTYDQIKGKYIVHVFPISNYIGFWNVTSLRLFQLTVGPSSPNDPIGPGKPDPPYNSKSSYRLLVQ